MSSAVLCSLPKRIHLVGIAGSGLSAIARVLVGRGHNVSGSDLRSTPTVGELNRLGVRTYVGHSATNIAHADAVVVSSAIPETNVEIQAAIEAGIPVLKRRQILGHLTADRCGIAVAGTHGKTTTSAMLAVILQRAGLEPSFIVGGVVTDLGSNGHSGRGRHFVIEADEYDRTFHGLAPDIAVVTNVEMDHPDCYRDMADMREAYAGFLSRVSCSGHIVACADSPDLMTVLHSRAGDAPKIVTYGVSARADYVVRDARANLRGGVDFTVIRDGGVWGRLSLSVPGVHNALNATAALIVSSLVGAEQKTAVEALAGFRGALRRFEVKGEQQGILVVDDYAHHPTEIRATLAAARMRYGQANLWAVLQPHTYSRLNALLPEFAAAFADADHVIVTDVFAARAQERPTVTAEELVALMEATSGIDVRHISLLDDASSFLLGQVVSGDVVLTLGAGDGYTVGEQLLRDLARQEELNDGPC